MKRSFIYVSAVVLLVGLIAVGCSNTMTAANKKDVELRPEMKVAVGQELYACNCGATCPCDTLSMNPGKCTCGKDMVKAKVQSVGQGTAVLRVSGEERTFKTIGKYACACGPKCPCNTISQNPGKCSCGVEMNKV